MACKISQVIMEDQNNIELKTRSLIQMIKSNKNEVSFESSYDKLKEKVNLLCASIIAHVKAEEKIVYDYFLDYRPQFSGFIHQCIEEKKVLNKLAKLIKDELKSYRAEKLEAKLNMLHDLIKMYSMKEVNNFLPMIKKTIDPSINGHMCNDYQAVRDQIFVDNTIGNLV